MTLRRIYIILLEEHDMETILFTLGLFGLCFLGLGIGALLGGRSRIKGSCGGVASGNADESCSVCGGDPDRCESKTPLEDPHYSRLHRAFQQK